MPRVTYSAERSALVSALALPALPADAAARSVATSVLAELDAVGAAYDAAWADDGAILTARESTYASALAAWGALFSPEWEDATAVLKYLEHKIYAARVGVVLDPRVLSTPLGTLALTEHTDALPSPWADPATPVTATKTLNASGGVPVLRIEARPPGIGGNAVKVTVSAPSSGRATECKITVTRGTTSSPYVETFDGVDVATADGAAPDAGASLLIRSFTKVGFGRPVDAAISALTGGAGNVLDTMTARIERLVLAAQSGDTALTATDRRTAESLRQRLDSLWSSLPTLVNPLEEFEQQLRASIARAEEQTALLVAVYP